jgi:hypothetical protein
MGMPSFLKKEGHSIIYNGKGTLVFFIPTFFFSKGYAESIGENISLFGVFDYAIYDEKGNISKSLTNFKLPTVFLTRPSNMETKKDVKLTKNTKPQDYRLLKYKQGDLVFVSCKLPQSIDNAEMLFKMMITADMPNTIPYDKIHDYWELSMALNGTKYGISQQIFGIFSSEVFRKIDDKTIPFRLSGEKDMTRYQMISIKMIPNLVTPFTAFISENWDESMVYASMNNNKKEIPLEKIMMM